MTDWSSDEFEWWAPGSRSVSDPDRAGSTDRERVLVEADTEEANADGGLGERDE